MEDDFSTMGADGFETVGYEDEMLGAAPSLALRRPAFAAAAARAPAGARPPIARFNPAAFQAARQIASGISAEQARQIVRDELARLRQQDPMVPWQKMPARATPRDEAMWPLGLGVITFDSTTGVNLALVVTPQRPFRGERLVIDTRRVGASAQAQTVVINDLRVGDVPQRIGGGLLPAEIFRPDAFGVRLSLDASVPGVLVTLGFQLIGPALAPGDSITLSAGVVGRATESGDR
jgi:hypothetical protein